MIIVKIQLSKISINKFKNDFIHDKYTNYQIITKQK